MWGEGGGGGSLPESPPPPPQDAEMGREMASVIKKGKGSYLARHPTKHLQHPGALCPKVQCYIWQPTRPTTSTIRGAIKANFGKES